MPLIARLALFTAAQVVLVTPAALIGAALYFLKSRPPERQIPGGVAAICAAVAAINILAGYLQGRMGLAASGAIWLPLLPFIAAGMQPPGKPSPRWWGPVIYLCVICYGVYSYWLAFPD
jgi:drug/metabolite transporter (DMT)-like permease